MLTFDEIVDSFLRINPTKIVVSGENRKLSYRELADNGSLLSSYLINLGLCKGDRVALLAYNCVEYAEIFYATSKSGSIITPINFRLGLLEIIEVLNDSKAKFLFFKIFFENLQRAIKTKFNQEKNSIIIGTISNNNFCKPYYEIFTKKINKSSSYKKKSKPEDLWSLMYTSGTTGKPKGVVRNHSGYYMLSFVTATELSIVREDNALIVMPLCHANSFNFFALTYMQEPSITIYSKKI